MRDAVIIGIACFIAIGAGAWLFFAGEAAPAAYSGPVAYETYAEGQDSGTITERKNYRIKNPEELEELWRMIYGADAPPQPPIDFTRQELLALFDGTHSSGGFDIAVTSVTDEAGVTREVAILHSVPGEECMVSQAITSPFVIVSVPATTLPLKRTDSTQTRECE